MSQHATTPPARYWAWAGDARSVFALAAAVTAARLAYLALLCPYTLVEDEAHYWEWSRHLALSYYTKGPGIAWTIAGFTWVFGDAEAAIRAAAPVASGVCALALAWLARAVFADSRRALFSALLFLLIPMFQVAGLTMTIDGPYAACWALAAAGAWMAMGRDKGWGWLVCGAAIGAGLLYKYTILLLLPGLVGFAATHPATVRGRWGWIGAGALLAGAGAAPIAAWNAANGWPTITHLLGHLGVSGGDMPVRDGWSYSPTWTLEFLGAQAGMIGPALALMAMGVRDAWRARRAGDPGAPGRAFLLWCGVPILVFYLLLSFFAEPEGNWALAGYLTLIVVAADVVVRGMDDWKARVARWRALPVPRPRLGFVRRSPETLVQGMWHATLVCGIGVAVVLPRLDLVAGLPVIGPRVPIGRFTGADRMGQHAASLAGELRRETGLEPFCIGLHYGRASQLAYYMPGRPVVYCSSGHMTRGRPTAYDFWPDTDLLRQPQLAGRPAVVVGATRDDWLPFFERVEEFGRLDGDGKRGRPAFKAYGFKGFAR